MTIKLRKKSKLWLHIIPRTEQKYSTVLAMETKDGHALQMVVAFLASLVFFLLFGQIAKISAQVEFVILKDRMYLRSIPNVYLKVTRNGVQLDIT